MCRVLDGRVKIPLAEKEMLWSFLQTSMTNSAKLLVKGAVLQLPCCNSKYCTLSTATKRYSQASKVFSNLSDLS